MERRLYRSRTDRMIWGVCGGLARYFDMDPTIVRIITVLLVLANGMGILAYIILALVIPLESSPATDPKATIKENAAEMKARAGELGQEIRATFGDREADHRHHRHQALGIILVVLGGLFLLANLNVFWWLKWINLWPFIVIAVGLLIILSARRK